MSRYAHVRLEGAVVVGLPQAEAFELFTPSGERQWAAGWDPWFPADRADETDPGTVFQTRHNRAVTWVVAACERPRFITYANLSEDDRAGIVDVRCEPGDNGSTTAHVAYAMTALSDQGNASLREFAAHYEQYMNHWQQAIAAVASRQN